MSKEVSKEIGIQLIEANSELIKNEDLHVFNGIAPDNRVYLKLGKDSKGRKGGVIFYYFD